MQGVYQSLAQTLNMPFDPAKRLFWGFILTSLLLALVAIYIQEKKLSIKLIKEKLFSPSYWLTRSTLVDVSYLAVNNLLKVLVLVPLLGSQLWFTIVVARFFQSQFDTPQAFEISGFSVTVLYSLAFFIVGDFSRFILHFAMHKIPFLWSLHKVHHSAEVMTPLTLHRIHPIEMTLYYLRSLCVFGFISGLFVYLFGAKVDGFDILGVHALGFLFNAFGANLRHSHIWLSFGIVEHIFISPAQHQIHHSSDPAHLDKNFGTCLSIWDKTFGSWVASHRRMHLKFGIA